MLPDEIVISALPGDGRCAWLDRGRLIRFAISGDESDLRRGDILLGRVRRVVPALAAAFVDIGSDRPGFLMLADAAQPSSGIASPLSASITEGAAVIVQVIREPEGDKGAKLSGRLSVAGHTLAFIPGGSGISVDGSVAGDGWQEDVRRILPASGGWVLRSSAVPAALPVLAAEAAVLVGRWQSLCERQSCLKPPVFLDRAADPVTAMVADGLNPGLKRVLCDDVDTLATLRKALPSLEAVDTLLYRESLSLFSALAIEEQIEAVLAPVIPLPSGGRVSVAETRAMAAFDVDAGSISGNTGPAATLAVNLEAAAAIVQTVQLGEVGGHILIDFVPMRGRAAHDRVYGALKRAFADDERQTDLAGFTRFGLFEINRERRGPSLRQRLRAACRSCDGAGMRPAPRLVAGDALRRLLAEARMTPSQTLRLAATPEVIAALKGPLAAATEACAGRLGRPISLRVDPALADVGFRIESACG
jgi:Rne/Rng family ribonuclease